MEGHIRNVILIPFLILLLYFALEIEMYLFSPSITRNVASLD